MAPKMVQIRGFIAGVFALVLVVVLVAFGAAAMDIRLPLLSAITDAVGFTSP